MMSSILPWAARVRTRALSLGLLALTVAVSGCATPAVNKLAELGSEPSSGRFVVEVVNRNWQDMHVYATKGSVKYRLGRVGANETRELRLPNGLAGHTGFVRLAARPTGGRTYYYSDPVALAPGQRLGWSLESNLNFSYYWIR